MAREVTGGAQWQDAPPSGARLRWLVPVLLATGRWGFVEGASPDGRWQDNGEGNGHLALMEGETTGKVHLRVPSGTLLTLD